MFWIDENKWNCLVDKVNTIDCCEDCEYSVCTYELPPIDFNFPKIYVLAISNLLYNGDDAFNYRIILKGDEEEIFNIRHGTDFACSTPCSYNTMLYELIERVVDIYKSSPDYNPSSYFDIQMSEENNTLTLISDTIKHFELIIIADDNREYEINSDSDFTVDYVSSIVSGTELDENFPGEVLKQTYQLSYLENYKLVTKRGDNTTEYEFTNDFPIIIEECGDLDYDLYFNNEIVSSGELLVKSEKLIDSPICDQLTAHTIEIEKLKSIKPSLKCIENIVGRKYVSIPPQFTNRTGYIQIYESGIVPGNTEFETLDGLAFNVGINIKYIDLNGNETSSSKTVQLYTGSSFEQIRDVIVQDILPYCLSQLPVNTITFGNSSTSMPGFYIQGGINDNYYCLFEIGTSISEFTKNISDNINVNYGGEYIDYDEVSYPNFYRNNNYFYSKFAIKLTDENNNQNILNFYNFNEGVYNIENDIIKVERVIGIDMYYQKIIQILDELEIIEGDEELIEYNVCDKLENHEERITYLENNFIDLKKLPGYNDSETQTLKNITGTISWVTDLI